MFSPLRCLCPMHLLHRNQLHIHIHSHSRCHITFLYPQLLRLRHLHIPVPFSFCHRINHCLDRGSGTQICSQLHCHSLLDSPILPEVQHRAHHNNFHSQYSWFMGCQSSLHLHFRVGEHHNHTMGHSACHLIVHLICHLTISSSHNDFVILPTIKNRQCLQIHPNPDNSS
jgi:hypothetical protein